MDRQIEDKVLQLGSINDELKSTVLELNKLHSERNGLIEKLEGLERQIGEKERELASYKDKNLTEEIRHEIRLKSLVSGYDQKQKDLDVLLNFTIGLENKKDILREDVRGLTDEKKKLVQIKERVAKLREQEAKLEKTNRDIARFGNAKNALAKEIVLWETKLKELKSQVKKEKGKHGAWLTETRQKAMAELARATSKTDALYKQKKDLIVVEKRLKKIWEQTSDSPFPKIYHA